MILRTECKFWKNLYDFQIWKNKMSETSSHSGLHMQWCQPVLIVRIE
jgi:hypothetical protein